MDERGGRGRAVNRQCAGLVRGLLHLTPRMDASHRWSELRPGIVLVIAIIAATVAVLVFGRVGALHGERVRVHVIAEEAGGVLTGSEVWLNGRKIGRVESLSALPTSPDTLARVLVTLEVLDEFAGLIRHDAVVRIQAGGRLLGAPVVSIEGGSPRAPGVANGDTLRSRTGGAMGSAAERLAAAQDKLPLLVAAGRGVVSDLGQITRATSVAMSRMPIERGKSVMSEASSVAAGISRFVNRGDGGLGARVAQVRARVDSVRKVVASSTGTLGRFRRDSTLAQSIAAVRQELATLSAAASSPAGSLGRFAADSALQRELGAMSREMSALLADVKRRPLRYLSF